MLAAALLAAAVISCPEPVAKDGDNVLCAGLDLRIEGVNAREMDDSCRPASPCPQMSGVQARAVLQRLVDDGLTYAVRYRDRFGRRVVTVTLADGRDLACALIEAQAAARWERYWPEVKRCP